MASPYDKSLLALAPKATNAQHGYHPNIFIEKTPSTPTAPGHLTPVRRQSEDALPLQVTKKKVPFYATKKGIIFIAVVGVVIIAAVVGGAVGGTRKKKTSIANEQGGPILASSTPISSTGITTQGFGSPPKTSTNSNPSPTITVSGSTNT